MERFTELLYSLSHVDAAIIAAMITASIAAIVTIVVAIVNAHYNSKMTKAQIENNSEMTKAQIENNAEMTRAQIEHNSEMTKAQIASEEIRVSLPYLKDILNELRDAYSQIKDKESFIIFTDAMEDSNTVAAKIIEIGRLAVKIYPNVSPYLKEENKNRLNELYYKIEEITRKFQKDRLTVIHGTNPDILQIFFNEEFKLLDDFRTLFKNCLFEEISSIMGSLRVYSDVNRILKDVNQFTSKKQD